MSKGYCTECEDHRPPGDNYCSVCGTELMKQVLPRTGTVYFHEDAVDSVVKNADFADLEPGSDVETALRDWMYEVAVNVRVTADLEVVPVSINGREVVQE